MRQLAALFSLSSVLCSLLISSAGAAPVTPATSVPVAQPSRTHSHQRSVLSALGDLGSLVTSPSPSSTEPSPPSPPPPPPPAPSPPNASPSPPPPLVQVPILTPSPSPPAGSSPSPISITPILVPGPPDPPKSEPSSPGTSAATPASPSLSSVTSPVTSVTSPVTTPVTSVTSPVTTPVTAPLTSPSPTSVPTPVTSPAPVVAAISSPAATALSSPAPISTSPITATPATTSTPATSTPVTTTPTAPSKPVSSTPISSLVETAGTSPPSTWASPPPAASTAEAAPASSFLVSNAPAGPLPTATSSSPGVDTKFAATASVPVAATPAAGSSGSPAAVGSTIQPPPAVQAAIANANIPESAKQVASAIATQTACPPDNSQAITLPLDGSVLATHTGQTCGTLPAVPEALQSAVQGGYTVTLSGDREDHSGATVTQVTVSLAGGSNFGTYTLPQGSGTTWAVNTNGYNFAVNASSTTVTVNGQNYSVPNTGFQADQPSGSDATSSTAGRKLFMHHSEVSDAHSAANAESSSSLRAAESADRPLQRRQLAQDSSNSVFGIQLTINKCASQMPVSNATVHALLTGFNAVDQPLALTASSSGGNIYSSVLDMGSMFPNLGYTNQATLNYCNANQANLQQACKAGMASGHNFSESDVLLNSCTRFLTDGALTNASSAARQVAVACAVMAVEMSLICTSSTTDCNAVATQTFTISVAAQEDVTGGPSNRTIAAFGTIYQNLVNGKPGDDVIHVDNISCSDIADGSCGVCSSSTSAQPVSNREVSKAASGRHRRRLMHRHTDPGGL